MQRNIKTQCIANRSPHSAQQGEDLLQVARLATQHLRHHAVKDYFSPNYQKLLGALGAAAVVSPIAIWLAGPLPGATFALSFVLAYLYYEWTHWSAHKRAPRTAYGRWVRKNHFAHHFNSPKHNHGVTSGVWDLVFRTTKPPRQVRVPRKFAMCWLVDEAGAVRPEYRADYCLTGRATHQR